MSLALAEDWVTVSTLCPLAGVPAEQVLTHSIGLTRARLISKRPPLSPDLLRRIGREAPCARM